MADDLTNKTYCDDARGSVQQMIYVHIQVQINLIKTPKSDIFQFLLIFKL